MLLKRIALCLPLSLVSCVTPRPGALAPLSVLVSSGDQDPFDPDQSAQATLTLQHSFFCYPLKLDRHQKVQPDAVRSWVWSEDQRTLMLELDPDQRFHDGRRIQPEDLEFALVRPFLTTTGRDNVNSGIEGTDALQKGQTFVPGMVSGITSPGPGRLSIRLKQPDPDFLYYLASNSSRLIPRDALATDAASFSNLPISCGDYRVVDMVTDRSRYHLKKFREIDNAPEEVELWNYEYDKLPGKPDVMMGGLFSKEKLDRSYYRTQWSEEPTVAFTLVLNDKAPIVHLPAFRKAMNLAIPRQTMADLRDERPAAELTAPGADAYLSLRVQYDPAEAKRLWMTLPSSLRALEYRITVKTNYPGPYFQAIESSLRSVGMKVTLRAKQMKDFREADEQDLMLGLGMTLLRDKPLAMYQRFDARQSRPDPFPAFAHRTLHKLLDDYSGISDPVARKAAARKVARYVLNENLVLPMTYGRSLMAFSPRVKSYEEARDSGVVLRLLRLNLLM